jgi:hypothetical protein
MFSPTSFVGLQGEEQDVAVELKNVQSIVNGLVQGVVVWWPCSFLYLTEEKPSGEFCEAPRQRKDLHGTDCLGSIAS